MEDITAIGRCRGLGVQTQCLQVVNCGYDFEALKATVSGALASVTNASTRGWQSALLMLILLVCVMGRKGLSTMYTDHIGRWGTSQSGEIVSSWTV